jgi:hypothetical protein
VHSVAMVPLLLLKRLSPGLDEKELQSVMMLKILGGSRKIFSLPGDQTLGIRACLLSTINSLL